MEKPSVNLQVAIASVVFLMAGTFLGMVAGAVTGLIDFSQIAAAESGFGIPLVIIAFGFFALILLWWRTPLGYISGMVSGILFLVNSILASADAAAAGGAPVGLLYLTIPGIIFSLILIATSFFAWRE
ncbi:MAG: hypothetical protein GTO63_19225 [Anaerolineae bacterium]|nr:hypothetical protein [Anaerolineae bacterium]